MDYSAELYHSSRYPEIEIFTDLDFVVDVALLAEMLEVLILALRVMQEETA